MSDEVKDGYKEVRIGPKKRIIPNEWDVKSLSDVAKFINGKGFSSNDWEETGTPIVRIQNLNDPEAEYNYYSGEVKDKYVLENGDLLLSWSASLGAYKWDRGKAFLNQHIFKVEPKENIDKEFLYNILIRSIEKLVQKTHGSTMKHIRKKDLSLTFFPAPPLSEQKKIADILSTVDQAIAKTDEIIEKTKELKKGLMQELLTKGIGHDEFKKTILGELPGNWEVKQLREICSKVTDGTHGTPEIKEEGYPFITAKDITNGKLDFSSCGYVDEKVHKKIISRSKPEQGDILMIHIGATVGRVIKVDVDFEFSIKNVALFKPKPKIINSDYFNYALEGSPVQSFINRILQGGVQPYLSLTTLRGLNVPLPPLEEQKKIANILSTVDKKIQKKQEKKEKLERLKKGLMQKLLTGEVRVSVKE